MLPKPGHLIKEWPTSSPPPSILLFRNKRHKTLCKLCLHPISFHPIRRSLRADGQVGLFMRSLQDGRRENVGHSAYYKSFQHLAYSLHIKEEVGLAQESDPESPPSQNHSSRTTDLSSNRSSPTLNSKTHFGALLKLRASRQSSEHLKDLPRLLEATGLWHKSLASGKEPLLQEAFGDQGIATSHLSSFDLKIPQVRGMLPGKEQSWCSVASEHSGSVSENGLGKALISEQIHKSRSGVHNLPGAEKEYWPYESNQLCPGGHCAALDSEADFGSKQPRKKRGRYRQYNTELLEEAIVVVMGGKMSVSKAQSVYGIPHSTLEYKVKERLGTLKHPPKKKMRLMSQAEEQDALESPESKGDLQDSQDTAFQQECPSTENGTQLCNSGLTPDEYSTMKPKCSDDVDDDML